jgi:hypothetical protein
MTVYAYPASYSSVHGDLIYTVYDSKVTDSTTYPNYKYIADVYIGGALISRLRKTQDPETGVGIFNISQVVRNYLTTEFNPTGSVLRAQELGEDEFFVKVIVKFGEEYSYTSYYDITTDSERTFFNNYNARLAGITSSLSDKTNEIASNRPLSGHATLETTHYFVPYFPTSTSLVNVTVTPSGGGSVYSTSFTPTAANNLQVLNIAPAALNALSAGTITSATTSYTVEIGGQTIAIEMICEPIYDPYPIHFLNQYGGFETKIFNKASREKYKVERKSFGKLNYTVDNSGTVNFKNSNGVYNEGRSVYSAQFDEKLTLNSDLLTDDEYVWLRDLIMSPMVYLQDGAYFFPVEISETDYEVKKVINDELTNLVITIEYGQNLNAQYR